MVASHISLSIRLNLNHKYLLLCSLVYNYHHSTLAASGSVFAIDTMMDVVMLTKMLRWFGDDNFLLCESTMLSWARSKFEDFQSLGFVFRALRLFVIYEIRLHQTCASVYLLCSSHQRPSLTCRTWLGQQFAFCDWNFMIKTHFGEMLLLLLSVETLNIHWLHWWAVQAHAKMG